MKIYYLDLQFDGKIELRFHFEMHDAGHDHSIQNIDRKQKHHKENAQLHN